MVELFRKMHNSLLTAQQRHAVVRRRRFMWTAWKLFVGFAAGSGVYLQYQWYLFSNSGGDWAFYGAGTTQGLASRASGMTLGGHVATAYNHAAFSERLTLSGGKSAPLSSTREPSHLRLPLHSHSRAALGPLPKPNSSSGSAKKSDSVPDAAHDAAVDADVVVVGAGFAGLHAALVLAEKYGKRVVVLERVRIGCGASGRNGGDAVVGFHTTTEELEVLVGREATKTLFGESRAGYDRLKSIIAEHKIQCDAREEGAVTVAFARKGESAESVRRALHDATAAALHAREHYGEEREVWDKSALESKGFHSDRYSHGVFTPRNITLNPLELALGIARACEGTGRVVIHEASPVVRITPVTLEAPASLSAAGALPVPVSQQQALLGSNVVYDVATPTGSVRARHVVLATNGCPPSLSPSLALATIPLSTGMMLTHPLPKEVLDKCLTARCAIFDERNALAYFRRAPGDRVLFGGTVSAAPQRPEQLAHRLLEDFDATFPSLEPFVEVDTLWQGRLEARWPVFPLLGRLEGVDAPSAAQQIATAAAAKHAARGGSALGAPFVAAPVSVPSGIWYSVGFSGHGLVPTVAAAEVLGRCIAKGTPAGDKTFEAWQRVQLVPSMPGLWPVGGPWGCVGASVVIAGMAQQDAMMQR